MTGTSTCSTVAHVGCSSTRCKVSVWSIRRESFRARRLSLLWGVLAQIIFPARSTMARVAWRSFRSHLVERRIKRRRFPLHFLHVRDRVVAFGNALQPFKNRPTRLSRRQADVAPRRECERPKYLFTEPAKITGRSRVVGPEIRAKSDRAQPKQKSSDCGRAAAPGAADEKDPHWFIPEIPGS